MGKTRPIDVDELYKILLKARGDAEQAIITSTISTATDDQDCYPRGIVLTKENVTDTIANLKKLSSVFSWIKFDSRRRMLHLLTEGKTTYRLQEFAAFSIIEKNLNEAGIDCYVDVNWHG